MDLFTKFETAPKAELKLPKESVEFFEMLQKQYNGAVLQLNDWRAGITALTNARTPDDDHIRESGSHLYNDGNVGGNHFLRLYFSPKYAIKHINEKIATAQGLFCEKILNHFKEKYNVKLDVDFKDAKDLHEWKDVVKLIQAQVGTLDFDRVGRDAIIAEFKRKLQVSAYRVRNGESAISWKIGKKKITISEFHHWGESWGDSKIKHYRGQGIEQVDPILHLFNNGNAQHDQQVQKLNEGVIVWDKHATGYKKTPEIKCFQNGRLDIFFDSQTSVEDFKNKYLV